MIAPPSRPLNPARATKPRISGPKGRSRWCLLAAVAALAGLSPSALHGQADSAAAPTRWQRLHSDDVMSLWIDSQTARTMGDSRLTVWTDWRFAIVRGAGGDDLRYDSMKSHDDIDCESRTYRNRQAQFYLRGESMGSTGPPATKDLEWREPVPDSMAEALVNRVCFWAGFD